MADHGFTFTPADPELRLLRGRGRRAWEAICPHHFRCDLASVPKLLLPLCGPSELYQRAALFHDAGYWFQPVAYRSIIDEFFRAMLLYDGVKPWRAWLMWAAVRIFGGAAWRENAQCNEDCLPEESCNADR